MAEQKITGFHRDDDGHWTAELACGHAQHVRHSPPWQIRPWVLHESLRGKMLGRNLRCLKCERAEPLDGDWAS